MKAVRSLMKLMLAAVGHLKSGPERDLYARYAARIETAGRGVGLGPLTLRETPESRARRAQDRKSEEAQAILALCEPRARLIALDERGRAPTSEQFAQDLAQARDQGAWILFAIGGADGLDPALRDRAQSALSFGAMTLPHQLARIILAEQIYRACTILSGHPYHRA